MSPRKNRFLIGIGFVVLFIATVGVLYWFSNSQAIRTLVLNKIDQAFGQKIRISHVHFAFFPHPKIEFIDVTLGDQGTEQPFFRASHVTLDLSPSPLFFHKIVPERLTIVSPEFVIHRNVDGEWGLSEEGNLILPSSTLRNMLFIPMITVMHGRVVIRDDYHPHGSQELRVEEFMLDVQSGSYPADIEVTLSATVFNHNQGSQISLSSTLQFLSVLSSTGETARSPEPFENIKISGRTRLDDFDMAQVAEFLRFPQSPFAIQSAMTIQSDFHINPGLQGYDLVLTDTLVHNPLVRLVGHANVSGLFTDEAPTFLGTFSSQPFALSTLQRLMPENGLPLNLQSLLTEGNVGGSIQVISADIAGSSRPDVGFSFGGEFQLTQGHVNLGATWGKAEDVSARIFMRSDQVRLVEGRGVYNSIPVHSATGFIDLQKPDLWFETELQGDVTTEQLMQILHRIFSKNELPSSMMLAHGISGGGLFTVRFSGFLMEPDDIQFQDAVYVIKNGALDVPILGTDVSDIQGRIHFSRRHLGFDHVAGRIGTNPFHLDGNLRFEETNVFDELQLQGTFHVQDVMMLVFDEAHAPMLLQGKTAIDLVFSGQLSSPHIRGSLGLDDVGIFLHDVFEKKQGIPGSLDFEARVYSTGEILLKRIELSMLPFRLSGQATLHTKPTFIIDTSLSIGLLDLSSLPPGMVIGNSGLKAGTFEMSLHMTGRGMDWRTWKKNGWLALTDGVLSHPEFDDPITNLFLRLKLTKDIAEIERLEFHMQESQARVTGTIRHWASQPEMTFTFISPQFDLDLLIPTGDRSPMRDFLEVVADGFHVQGDLQFTKAWYKALQFSSLRGKLSIQDHMISVNSIEGALPSGEIKGQLVAYLPKQQPTSIKTWLDLKEIPLEPIFDTFVKEEFKEDRLIFGQLAMKGILYGHGRDIRGPYPTLNGEVHVAITNGRIQRGTIVPKILAILNLPVILQGKVDFSEDGYPFDKQTATIHIQDGILTSEDIVIDGPILPMTAAGSYDLDNDQLDVVMAVSPFGSYSDLLKKIPLFGMLFEGKREAIDTALFDVKGSLHDPIVTYRPLGSFQAGLTGLAKFAINILKNTITLPVKLIMPSTEPEEDSEVSDQVDETLHANEEVLSVP